MYIKLSDALYAPVSEEALAAYATLPAGKKPKLYAATSKEVKAYLAAQAEAAKPKSITARQAHEALIRKGLRDNIVNAIAGIPDPVEQALADNWFQRSNTFERNNETLVSIAGAIGLTSNDIDNLFAYAATL